MLDEIVGGGGRVQVTQAVEPNARTQPATYLGFGFVLAFGDALYKSGIAHLGEHRHLF